MVWWSNRLPAIDCSDSAAFLTAEQIFLRAWEARALSFFWKGSCNLIKRSLPCMWFFVCTLKKQHPTENVGAAFLVCKLNGYFRLRRQGSKSVIFEMAFFCWKDGIYCRYMVEWAKSCRLAVSPPYPSWKGGDANMVSWTELFLFGTFIVSIIALCKKGK